MWAWPAIGFAWGLGLAIAFGPFLGVFGIVAAFLLANDEHKAETVIATAMGTAAALGVLLMLPGIASTPVGDFRLGP